MRLPKMPVAIFIIIVVGFWFLLTGNSSQAVQAAEKNSSAMRGYWQPQMNHNEVIASSTVFTLTRVQLKYSKAYPKSGYAPDLKTLGPGSTGSCPTTGATAAIACMIDSQLGCSTGTGANFCTKSNYKFNLRGIASRSGKCCQDYVIFATPASVQDGHKNICATSDLIIRWRDVSQSPSIPVSPADCSKWEPI